MSEHELDIGISLDETEAAWIKYIDDNWSNFSDDPATFKQSIFFKEFEDLMKIMVQIISSPFFSEINQEWRKRLRKINAMLLKIAEPSTETLTYGKSKHPRTLNVEEPISRKQARLTVGTCGYSRRNKLVWKKILYENQPYPDNYIPPTFLQDLRRNVNLHHYSLKESLLYSAFLTQEINCIIIFLQVFNLLQSEQSYSNFTCLYISLFTLFLYLTLLLSFKRDDVIGEIKTGTIFIISGFAVSPILKTLTETISTDTIYTMVTLMMIVHLIFFDYGIEVAIVSPSLSVNSAIFAGVCLASRLSSSHQAFALLTFATDVFVLFDVFRSKLRDALSIQLNYLITCLLTLTSMVLLVKLCSPIFFLMYTLLLLLVNLILPYGFWALQSFKENIYGPWDEAIIKMTENSD